MLVGPGGWASGATDVIEGFLGRVFFLKIPLRICQPAAERVASESGDMGACRPWNQACLDALFDQSTDRLSDGRRWTDGGGWMESRTNR